MYDQHNVDKTKCEAQFYIESVRRLSQKVATINGGIEKTLKLKVKSKGSKINLTKIKSARK